SLQRGRRVVFLWLRVVRRRSWFVLYLSGAIAHTTRNRSITIIPNPRAVADAALASFRLRYGRRIWKRDAVCDRNRSGRRLRTKRAVGDVEADTHIVAFPTTAISVACSEV